MLDSLYEDDSSRRQLQLQNAGYGYGGMSMEQQFQNPFVVQAHDPFSTSNNISPPTNVQLSILSQQQQHNYQEMMMQQQYQHNNKIMVPRQQYMHEYPQQYSQYPEQQSQHESSSNPFGDLFSNMPSNAMPQKGNNSLI